MALTPASMPNNRRVHRVRERFSSIFKFRKHLFVSGGKAIVCERILQQHRHKRLIVIGDGATDIEAAPPAHAAIGFGGNVVRQTVCLFADFSQCLSHSPGC